MSLGSRNPSVDVETAVRLELLVVSLWSIAALVILVCFYEYSNIVLCISQVSDKVLKIHKCLLVWINIAYTRRLVLMWYVVLLLPCGGVAGVCLIANSIYC
jgi:hypothetical protein